MPYFKLRNFNPVKTVNGKTPDLEGNVVIPMGGGGEGSSYLFKEEIFIALRRDFTLKHYPYPEVPLTVTINGIVLTKNDYTLVDNTVVLPEGSVETNDIVRIMYAHGG